MLETNSYSLSLELVRSNDVSDWNHLVLIDRVKILRNILWDEDTQVRVELQRTDYTHINERAQLIL